MKNSEHRPIAEERRFQNAQTRKTEYANYISQLNDVELIKTYESLHGELKESGIVSGLNIIVNVAMRRDKLFEDIPESEKRLPTFERCLQAINFLHPGSFPTLKTQPEFEFQVFRIATIATAIETRPQTCLPENEKTRFPRARTQVSEPSTPRKGL